ncbi:MAG: SDR family oxidoreductase [Deltaproteobacteria bacterium]|nr:SDR family oxidoreductase [Deltaproteobacteria bacterium]
MSRVRYLVTGGGGFIGSNIVEALCRAGERVRVIDDFSTGHRKNLDGLDVELFEGSIVDGELVAKAMAGVEVVFHEAALPSVPRSIAKPLDSDSVNVHGTLTVLEAARHAGVRRVLYAGSSSAYGDTPTLPKREDMTPRPLSPYAVAKHTGELYLSVYARLHKIETLSFRYFNVFGPRQDPNGAYAAVIPRWIAAALRAEPISINGDGGQTRDFCFIENVVRGNLLAASSERVLEGQVVNISCAERISLLQLADAIEELTGKELQRVHAPARAGDVRDSLADISRIGELLGYEPVVRWREGLERTVAHLAGRSGLISS